MPERVFYEDDNQGSLTLAESILDFDLDDVLEPWPRCPIHFDHPLYLELWKDAVWWVCRRDNSHVAILGGLSAEGFSS